MNKFKILNDLRVTGIDHTKTGLLVLVSSPSGGGKTTIINKLLKDTDYRYSISMTTRQPRKGEINGRDYIFTNQAEFEHKIENGLLLEYENVHGNYYGTPTEPVQEWLSAGNVVIIDIDVKGAMQIKAKYPQQTLLIFLKPPDLDVLKKRLLNRSTESQQQIEKRLQRVQEEYTYTDDFDHVIINNKLDDTVEKVKSIIEQKMQFI